MCAVCGGDDFETEPCETCPRRVANERMNGGLGQVVAAAQDMQRVLALGFQVDLDSACAVVVDVLGVMEQERQKQSN